MLPCSLTIGVELSQNRVVSSEGKSGSSNKVAGPDCGLPSSFMAPVLFRTSVVPAGSSGRVLSSCSHQ